MSRRLLLVALAVAAALAVVPAASPLTLFNDPANDAQTAPDVTAVAADNDAAGTITISAQTNQPTLASDAVLFVTLDTDANPSTGAGGIEYLFALDSGGYDFVMWNGSAFVDAPNTTVHVFYSSSGLARFVVNRSELGNTSAFNFSIQGVQFAADNTVVARDLAPDSGTYSYTLTSGTAPPAATTTTTSTPPPPPPPPPPTPAVALGAPAAKAPGVHAGKPFTISEHVTTNGSPVKVACTAHVGSTVVHSVGHFVGGNATCTGLAPRGSAGKRLTGQTTASISGAKKIRAFGFPIRA